MENENEVIVLQVIKDTETNQISLNVNSDSGVSVHELIGILEVIKQNYVNQSIGNNQLAINEESITQIIQDSVKSSLKDMFKNL